MKLAFAYTVLDVTVYRRLDLIVVRMDKRLEMLHALPQYKL
jgi:hypothetical protein